MLWAIDHPGKTPSDCRSPATSATGAATVRARPWMRGGGKGRKQKVGLAVSREAREPNDLPFSRHHIPIICLSLWAHAHNDWSFAVRSNRRDGLSPGGLGLNTAHGANQLRPVKSFARQSAVTTLPSRMTTIRSHVESTSPRICEISTQLTPDSTERRTWAKSCAAVCASSEEVGSSRMTSASGRIRDRRKRARFRPSAFGRSSGPEPGRPAVRRGRKDLVELVKNEPRRSASPAKAMNRRMNDARVFGHRKFGQSDSS